MDNISIRLELTQMAQKTITQLMLTNDQIGKQLEAGIKAAIEGFDFESEIKVVTEAAIRSAIKDSSSWGQLSSLVRKKADEIVNDHIEKHMQTLRDNL